MHGTKVENIPQLSTFDPDQQEKLVIASSIYDYAEMTTIRMSYPDKSLRYTIENVQ